MAQIGVYGVDMMISVMVYSGSGDLCFFIVSLMCVLVSIILTSTPDNTFLLCHRGVRRDEQERKRERERRACMEENGGNNQIAILT